MSPSQIHPREDAGPAPMDDGGWHGADGDQLHELPGTQQPPGTGRFQVSNGYRPGYDWTGEKKYFILFGEF